MVVQKGTVTSDMTGDLATIQVTGLNFVPNIVIVRIISDISTSAHSLFWVYTRYATFAMRTDSDGISAGLNSASFQSYSDNGYMKGDTPRINLIDNGFEFRTIDSYGPIQIGDIFEWTAIKYE